MDDIVYSNKSTEYRLQVGPLHGLCSANVLYGMRVRDKRFWYADTTAATESLVKEIDTPERAEEFFSCILKDMEYSAGEDSRNMFVFSDCISEDSWEGAHFGARKYNHIRFKELAKFLGIEPVTTYTSKRTGNLIAVYHYVVGEDNE